MADPGPLRITRARLLRAAAAGELFLAYQPKLDLRSDMVTGVEALARWQEPGGSMISPSLFISAVERAELIDWFSKWVLAVAAQQWSRWRHEDLDLELAVNISALNLRDVRFPDVVADICSSHGLPPSRLTLELTEGASLDATRLMDTVTRFRLKEIGISLDDFGTGYGSLVQLRGLPFTELKIDQSFVSDLLISRDSHAITRNLIVMAHDIGLCVTAEGVEDGATLSALRGLECDKAQGFHIAHPMRGDFLPRWLRGEADAEKTALEPRGLAT